MRSPRSCEGSGWTRFVRVSRGLSSVLETVGETTGLADGGGGRADGVTAGSGEVCADGLAVADGLAGVGMVTGLGCFGLPPVVEWPPLSPCGAAHLRGSGPRSSLRIGPR